MSITAPPAGIAAVDGADTEIDTYAMAHHSPRTTGLPLTIWVGPRGRPRHDARIKVSLTPGRMDVDNVAVVAVRPQAWRVTEGIGDAEFEPISRWIALNEAALIEYWDDAIDSAELFARLKKV